MATLKEIRTRIGSVKNTQKVTRAMQMIAAARLRKAQSAALDARAYAKHAAEMAHRIAERAGGEIDPYLQPRERMERVELLVLTSDRGLCGGFNANLLREVERHWDAYAAHGVEVHCTTIGRKGRDTLKARGRAVRDSLVGFYETLSFAHVKALAEPIATRFLEGAIDRVELVYNRFRSVIAQDITREVLLPMVPEPHAAGVMVDYLYEPSCAAVVHGLLHQALIARFYQACLESIAGELAARMSAMDNATKNASDMIHMLTMQFNRARQASITKELLDIVNGAESLKQ
ncbi:MAG: ATP synthase F1 subunit gamma [Deltaproteobacteria bacterium]|nr:ATP synthase F1 subunit gamma [Deltaproteobacteria bacterium]